jgi:hypothetical protein
VTIVPATAPHDPPEGLLRAGPHRLGTPIGGPGAGDRVIVRPVTASTTPATATASSHAIPVVKDPTLIAPAPLGPRRRSRPARPGHLPPHPTRSTGGLPISPPLAHVVRYRPPERAFPAAKSHPQPSGKRIIYA